MTGVTIDARLLDQEGTYPPIPTPGALVHGEDPSGEPTWIGHVTARPDGTWTATLDGASDAVLADLQVTGLATRGEAARTLGVAHRVIRATVDAIDALPAPKPRHGLWAIGVIVTHLPGGGWGAHVDLHDNLFALSDSISGRIGATYVDSDLAHVIDRTIEAVGMLGVEWREGPGLYMRGDGEDHEYPPPAGWRELLAEQSARLGWEPTYAAKKDRRDLQARIDAGVAP